VPDSIAQPDHQVHTPRPAAPAAAEGRQHLGTGLVCRDQAQDLPLHVWMPSERYGDAAGLEARRAGERCIG
jgi:hypothetical protein